MKLKAILSLGNLKLQTEPQFNSVLFLKQKNAPPLVSVDESKHAAWNNHNEKYPLKEDRLTKFFHFAAHNAYGSLVTVVENVM